MTFNGAMLTFARELNGLSKVELAKLVGCSTRMISRLEYSIDTMPDSSIVDTLASILSVKRSALYSKSKFSPFDLWSCHFRSLGWQSVRRRAANQGKLFAVIIDELSDLGVDFLPERIRDYEGPTPKAGEFANLVRRHWGMGLGPIGNMLGLLESKGLFVLPLAAELSRNVGPFSVWDRTHPYVFLDLDVTATQLRMDAAHQLGHLFMHEDALPGERSAQREAERFARSLLLPNETFGAECPRRWNLDHFVELSARWGAPIPSMLHRGFELGILSNYTLTQSLKRLDALGYARRSTEFGEPSKERPLALEQALSLVPHLTTLEELSEAAGFEEALVTAHLARAVSTRVLNTLQAKGFAYGVPLLRVIES